MKASDQIVLLYAIGAAGAAGVSYYRGRRGPEMLLDVAVHGTIAGTGFNVAAWLLLGREEVAASNPFLSLAGIGKVADMGKMGKKAIDLLSHVDGLMYEDFKKNGVKVAAIPENPSVVNQDKS